MQNVRGKSGTIHGKHLIGKHPQNKQINNTSKPKYVKSTTRTLLCLLYLTQKAPGPYCPVPNLCISFSRKLRLFLILLPGLFRTSSSSASFETSGTTALWSNGCDVSALSSGTFTGVTATSSDSSVSK